MLVTFLPDEVKRLFAHRLHLKKKRDRVKGRLLFLKLKTVDFSHLWLTDFYKILETYEFGFLLIELVTLSSMSENE